MVWANISRNKINENSTLIHSSQMSISLWRFNQSNHAIFKITTNWRTCMFCCFEIVFISSTMLKWQTIIFTYFFSYKYKNKERKFLSKNSLSIYLSMHAILEYLSLCAFPHSSEIFEYLAYSWYYCFSNFTTMNLWVSSQSLRFTFASIILLYALCQWFNLIFA